MKGRRHGGSGVSSPPPGAAKGGRAPGYGEAHMVPVFDSPSDFRKLRVKIGTSAFVGSNSENISRTTFLNLKTAENRELASCQ